MKFRSTLARLWDRYDTWVAYLFIAGFAALELLALAFPTVEEAIAPQVRLVLLCVGLLAFFRSLDASVGRITARVSTPPLTEGITRLLNVRRSLGEVAIAANDGIKYYNAISETESRIRHLRLLITSQAHLDNWRNLHARGLVDRLEIRVQPGPPTYHVSFVPGRIALFGAFTPRETGGFSAGTTVVVEDSSRELRALIAVYQQLFEQSWERAEVLLELGEATAVTA
jgi:hypothetical protein